MKGTIMAKHLYSCEYCQYTSTDLWDVLKHQRTCIEDPLRKFEGKEQMNSYYKTLVSEIIGLLYNFRYGLKEDQMFSVANEVSELIDAIENRILPEDKLK